MKHPLLFYNNVLLKGFLPGILENEARQRGKRMDSSKLFNDGLRDIVFRVEARHIPIDEPKYV